MLSQRPALHPGRTLYRCLHISSVGDPTLLPVYAPVIYDELGVNICQTLTIDDNTFSTLTTAEKAFVQILDIVSEPLK